MNTFSHLTNSGQNGQFSAFGRFSLYTLLKVKISKSAKVQAFQRSKVPETGYVLWEAASPGVGTVFALKTLKV